MTVRCSQRGSAMLVTLLLITALLSGAAILVSTQLSANRSTELVRSSTWSSYCAEAGLSAARPVVMANYPQWAGSLGTGVEPSWIASAIDHDLDGDGAADFAITLKDNDDETAPAPNNLARDNDLRIFIISRCFKYREVPKEVAELVQFSGGGTCYQSQQGGCASNGNSN
jgi:type II secretory pathway component PulK